MLIIEKRDDVVTLRNLGATDRQITRVFLFEGRLISFIGAVVGILLGLLLFGVGALMFVPAKMMGFYYPFLLASRFGRGTALVPEVQAPSYDCAIRRNVPCLDCAAVRGEDGSLNLFLVNRAEEPMDQAFKDAITAGYALTEPNLVIGSAMHDGEVFNDTRVFSARAFGRWEDTPGRVEVLFVEPSGLRPGAWTALCRSSRPMKTGRAMLLAGGEIRATVLERSARDGHVDLALEYDGDFFEILDRTGVPLSLAHAGATSRR
jgi:hypothetical protein